jgi:cob(II)yrinic acid a,c-diamide reductase
MNSHHTRPQAPMNGASASPVDGSLFRRAMRFHAAAVTILSAGQHGGRTGLTATSVCSLSDSPPSVIACVNRNASAHELVKDLKAFGVNLLRTNQTELASTFAGQRGAEGELRFSHSKWMSLVTGAPILRAALVSLDCELLAEHTYDTHSIFVGQVRAIHGGETEDPLIYFGGRFRSLDAFPERPAGLEP